MKKPHNKQPFSFSCIINSPGNTANILLFPFFLSLKCFLSVLIVTLSWFYYPFSFWLLFIVVLKIFEKIFSFLIHRSSFLHTDTSRHNLRWTLSQLPALHQRCYTHSSITFFRITCSCRNRLFLAKWVVRKISFCCAFSWYNSVSLSLCTQFTVWEKQAFCASSQEEPAVATNTATATESFWCLIFLPPAFSPVPPRPPSTGPHSSCR